MLQEAWRRLSRTAIVASIAFAELTACGAAGDGRYVGVASTEQGLCGQGFDEAGKATSTLLIRGSEVKFAPSDGVVVLEGRVDNSGHVLAQGITAGADRKPFLQVFEGDRSGSHIKGQFASPRCRMSVELTRR